MDNNGWGGDIVGKFLRLQTAMRVLSVGKGPHRERLNLATYPLATLSPRDFPQHLRNRAEGVLSLRGNYVYHAGDESYFRDVPPRERKQFVEDLTALYECCLIDIGRSSPSWDFLYPEDRREASAPKDRDPLRS